MSPAPTPISQKPISTTDARTRPTSSNYSHDRRLGGDLMTRVKYTNTLPDLPFDPKFLTYPFDENRFVVYSTTSLEKNFKYDVLTEPDLGVDVELVVPNAYTLPPPNAPSSILDPKDEKLLEEEVQPQKNQKRSLHHARNVSWLRRTEYISTEQTRFQPQTIEKVEAKVGYSIKKKLKDDWHYSDRDSQIKAIEKTFVESSKPITKHFAKPNVTPVEILPIFPDFKLWKYPCAQVIFDSDPAPVGRPSSIQIEEMSQAMIRGVMDESGEQFVAYFLPTEETIEKRKLDVEGNREYLDEEVYEYRMAREYNWNVKSKATKGYEENYFFVIRDDGVYYNELETRVRLNKRRTRGPNQQLNTKLCVKHIELATSDYKFQRSREKELEPLVEEEEDEEEDEKSEDETKPNIKNEEAEERSGSGSGSSSSSEEGDEETKKKTDDNENDVEMKSENEEEVVKEKERHSSSSSSSPSASSSEDEEEVKSSKENDSVKRTRHSSDEEVNNEKSSSGGESGSGSGTDDSDGSDA